MISHIYNSCLHLNHSSFKKNIQYEVDIYNKFEAMDGITKIASLLLYNSQQ